jgi:hypothetical protein
MRILFPKENQKSSGGRDRSGRFYGVNGVYGIY